MKNTRSIQHGIVITAICLVMVAAVFGSKEALRRSSEYQIAQTTDLTEDLIASWIDNRAADVKLWARLDEIVEYFDGELFAGSRTEILAARGAESELLQVNNAS